MSISGRPLKMWGLKRVETFLKRRFSDFLWACIFFYACGCFITCSDTDLT